MAAITIAGANATDIKAELLAIFTATRVGPVFRKWCEDNEILDVLDLSLLCADQDKFQAIVTKAKIEDLDKESACARKAWFLSRRARDSEASAAPAAGAAAADNDEMPLLHGVVENLRDLWFARHGFHLSGTRLVADSTFCRIFRGLHRSPKTLHIMATIRLI